MAMQIVTTRGRHALAEDATQTPGAAAGIAVGNDAPTGSTASNNPGRHADMTFEDPSLALMQRVLAGLRRL